MPQAVRELPQESAIARIEHVDATIAKIAYQQIVAELAKIGRGESHAPGRVEIAVRNKAADEITIGVENINEPVTMARYVIVLGRILFCICHVEIATDVFNVERRVTCRNVRVSEGPSKVGGRKIHIKNIDGASMEVSSVEEVARSIASKSKSFVNRLGGRFIHRKDSIGQIDIRVPTRYGAVFGVKNEKA